ncbi:MAG: hypothetical protein G8345_08330 [Magnetococcales bacterium]|nr:hypothetical protein [Magnetococcales bacterium]
MNLSSIIKYFKINKTYFLPLACYTIIILAMSIFIKNNYNPIQELGEVARIPSPTGVLEAVLVKRRQSNTLQDAIYLVPPSGKPDRNSYIFLSEFAKNLSIHWVDNLSLCISYQSMQIKYFTSQVTIDFHEKMRRQQVRINLHSTSPHSPTKQSPCSQYRPTAGNFGETHPGAFPSP